MSQNRMSEVRTSQRDSNQEQRLFSFKATQLIWLALGLLEALILLRIGLKIIGANPESLFAAFVYNFSYIFLFPFEGLIGTPSSGSNVLELSSFIAMAVYALLAWAFERVVWLVFYRPRGAVVNVTQQTTTGEPVAVIQAPLREPVAVIQAPLREPVAVIQAPLREPVAVMQTTTSEQYRE